jgi:CheY-like chemotaxis protein
MRQKLLLADDSITVQRVIELTFADEGLDIVTVGDGAQAIEHLRHDRADIVLADLNMPNVDGYAVAEHVKRTPDLVAQTRVVLLTGAFEPVDRDRAQKLGVDGILAKPFEPQVAIELVRQLLAQPPLSPPRIVIPTVAVAGPSDWAVDISARGGAKDAATVPGVPASESKPPLAAGYPFEPGAPATARSTPAELDDYFKRLDEALSSAGLKASPAVRDMLAESKEAANTASSSEGGAERAKASAAGGGTGTGGRDSSARNAQAGRPVGAGEERLMSGVPPRGPGKVTLVDAFSALLDAEQGDDSAEASLTASAWEQAPGTTDERASDDDGASFQAASTTEDAVEVAESVESVESRGYSRYDSRTSATGDADASDGDATGADAADSDARADAVEMAEEAAAPVAAAAVGAAAVTHVTSAAAQPAEAPAPVVSPEQLEAIVRKVLGEMTDRLVQEMRETVSNRVVDVAERLVREEIERLKAAAEADQA